MTDQDIWETAIKPYKQRIVKGKLTITVRSLREMIYRVIDAAATQEVLNEAKYADAMRSNRYD
jgi:hypothetical protein